MWVHYLPHWKETADAYLKRACFCTAPAIRRFIPNLVSEVIGTFVLVFVVGAIFSKSVAATGRPRGSAPISWGAWSGVSGSRSGYDRVRDQPGARLGPRIAHALLPVAGKTSSDWRYAPIPVLGPLVGGALAGVALRVLGVQ